MNKSPSLNKSIKPSSGGNLEDLAKEIKDLKSLREAWRDLDRPEFFPARPEHHGAWRKAYEAYQSYNLIIGKVASCFEEELKKLEPVLLTPSESDRSEQLERAGLCGQMAEELGLVQLAYRFRGLVEEVRSQEYLRPKPDVERLRLEDLHGRFKSLVEGAFASYKLNRQQCRPLLEQVRSLKKEYEDVGCSMWGAYCGGLVNMLERKTNG